MPAVLQITLLEIFRCAVGVYFVYNCVQCIILPELGELKIALIKIILGVWWCAMTLTSLKRQDVHSHQIIVVSP